MRLGDSLGFKCPLCIKTFLATIIDRCYPAFDISWTFPTANYILKDLRYALEVNSYSCEPYVLSALCHTARTTGCLPRIGFGFCFKKSITGKYGWACVEASVRKIIASSAKFGVVHSCEITVDQYVLLNRRSSYLARRRIERKAHETALKRDKKKEHQQEHSCKTIPRHHRKKVQFMNTNYNLREITREVLHGIPTSHPPVSLEDPANTNTVQPEAFYWKEHQAR